jgi:hypothetical protein
MCVCVCVCVCDSEKEREIERYCTTKRNRERERERQTRAVGPNACADASNWRQRSKNASHCANSSPVRVRACCKISSRRCKWGSVAAVAASAVAAALRYFFGYIQRCLCKEAVKVVEAEARAAGRKEEDVWKKKKNPGQYIQTYIHQVHQT